MDQTPLIEIGLPISLMIIMAGMGLTLTLGHFREVLLAPRALIVGTAAQILLIPAIAFAVIEVMGLPPLIAVGLIVVAACPGGTTSNVFTFLAKGNVALSILLTVIASLITIVTLPLFTNVALDLYTTLDADAPLRLPVARTVVTLAVIVILPVAAGMALRARRPALAASAERFVGAFGMLVLALLIVAIVYQTRDDILSLLAQAGPAAAILNIAGIAIGLASGYLSGIALRDALTIAIEVGIKNGTLGLLVALTLLDSPEIAIPSAVYGVLMFGFGALLVAWGRRQVSLAAESGAA
ncbi:bile acid:sodium symporter family protein [Salinisphaera sp. P385]|uniref:Bile acid:sodium symporter family protein n=1 Tax=Spectribacter acetivorans TaxID=3075603 RepID=A0ABU3BB09_9GAMM|nr:bile acid:sodium symporter family protein [Salinisphaera sp. P385]MDT0619007.1 bile acid:sodium symporter family protein [Salinisphaera sp. P385]